MTLLMNDCPFRSLARYRPVDVDTRITFKTDQVGISLFSPLSFSLRARTDSGSDSVGNHPHMLCDQHSIRGLYSLTIRLALTTRRPR